MKTTILVFTLALIFVACGSTPTKNKAETDVKEVEKSS